MDWRLGEGRIGRIGLPEKLLVSLAAACLMISMNARVSILWGDPIGESRGGWRAVRFGFRPWKFHSIGVDLNVYSRSTGRGRCNGEMATDLWVASGRAARVADPGSAHSIAKLKGPVARRTEVLGRPWWAG